MEVDAAAKVTANFQLNGSFAYTDATVVSFPNGPCYTGQTLAQGCYLDATNSRVQDLRGKRLNNVPKYKLNIGGEYDQPLGSLPFAAFASVAYRWQDDVNRFRRQRLQQALCQHHRRHDFRLQLRPQRRARRRGLHVETASRRIPLLRCAGRCELLITLTAHTRAHARQARGNISVPARLTCARGWPVRREEMQYNRSSYRRASRRLRFAGRVFATGRKVARSA